MTTKKNLILGFALGLLTASSIPVANAALVYFPNQDIPIPTTFAGVSVNFETGATTNALPGTPGADGNFFYGGEGVSNDADQTMLAPSWQPVRASANNTDPIVNLAVGAIIDSSSPTGNDFGASGDTVTHFATFTSGTPGHVGFSIVLADNTLAYGWARVTFQSDNTPGVIHEWGYETTGAPIQVGQIPEPSHTLLVALGLASLALRRRR